MQLQKEMKHAVLVLSLSRNKWILEKDFSESEMENMMNLSLYKSLATYGENATSI